MLFKKILSLTIIACVLCAPSWGRELKIWNDATLALEVAVKAQGYESTGSSSTIVRLIQPGEEIAVVIDEKNFSDSIFSVQGITITESPASRLVSNECILSGRVVFILQDECEPSEYEDRVVFTLKNDNSALVCSVSEGDTPPFRLEKI